MRSLIGFILTLGVLATLPGCSGSALVRDTNSVIHRHAALMQKNHDVRLMKVTPEKREGIQEKDTLSHLDLQYYVYRLMEVEDARRLVTEIIGTLVKEINNSEEIRPHLATYPFTTDQLTVKVDFNHFFGDYFEPLYIKTVALQDNMLTYYTFNKKIKRRETFTKAEQLVVEVERKRMADAEDDEQVIVDNN